MSLQEKETLELAQAKMQEYLQDNAVCSMDEYVQHGTTSTLQHCLSVVRISCAIAVGLHIHVNYENLILGALLHDFYLYDWHNHVDEGVLHGFAHPHIACKNAAMRFHVNAQHLFSALFCEMLGQLHKEIDAPDKGDSPKEGIKQADYTLRKFVELLSKDKGMHRSVSYYADALCYTPKHFSKVIKQACGRTPLDLINETTIEHIKYRLKRSDKSVKEIAEEFNFPNQSFFGKYVKMHLGTSPANYRNRKNE